MVERSHRLKEAFENARSSAALATAAIDQSLREAKDVAETIAKDLSEGRLPYGEIEERMRKDCGWREDIDGLAVTFEPFVYATDKKLYQEYVSRKSDGKLDTLKGATYDYSRPPTGQADSPKTAWYHTPLRNGSTWNEPFLATGAKKVLVEYGTTFTRLGDNTKAAGVVTVDFSLMDLQTLMGRFDLGSTGYGIAFTKKGTFLAHPIRSQIIQGSVYRDESLQSPELQDAIQKALAGGFSSVEHVDPITGAEVWVLFEPIPVAGWVLALVLERQEGGVRSRESLRQAVSIALPAAGTLLLFFALLVRLERGTTASLWITTAAFSVLCTGLIVLTWVLAWHVKRAAGTPVASRTAVERYLDKYKLSLTRVQDCHTVPTGLQLSAFKFPDASSATLGGFLWQRYPHTIPKSVKRGVLFAQSLSEQALFEEVQHYDEDNEEVIVWRFLITLQQSFDPALFPFDRRNLSMMMQPADLEANLVFVPDLAAYPVVAPRALPGVNKELQVNNWRFEESFFSYRMQSQSSTIGMPSHVDRPVTPVLYFNLALRRHYLGPFIAYLLPAIVAAGLAFGLLASRREIGSTSDLLNGLSYIAALFFVIVVAHTALRDNIGAVSITYLEHLFILLYVMVAFVVLDAFAVAYLPETSFVKWRNHLAVRLAYWPIITGTLLFTTLEVFAFVASSQ